MWFLRAQSQTFLSFPSSYYSKQLAGICSAAAERQLPGGKKTMNLKMPGFIQGAQTNSRSPSSYQASSRLPVATPAPANGFLRERQETEPTVAPQVLYLLLGPARKTDAEFTSRETGTGSTAAVTHPCLPAVCPTAAGGSRKARKLTREKGGENQA